MRRIEALEQPVKAIIEPASDVVEKPRRTTRAHAHAEVVGVSCSEAIMAGDPIVPCDLWASART